MELRHLRYFVAVAEELHFGRAARRLHMAQPPLSQQIKAFENELGVRLFERTRRKVELSQAGKLLLGEARKTLAQAEVAERVAREAQAGLLGCLRIGFVVSASYSILPEVLRRYRSAHPGITLQLHEMTPAQQMEALDGGGIDVGLMRLPVPETCYQYTKLFDEPLVAALPKRHPLARLRQVALAQLAKEPFILFRRGHGPGIHDAVVRACHEAGFSPRAAYEANEMQAVLGYVAGGLGVALVPASLTAFHRGEIAYLAVRRPAITVALAVIARPAESDSHVRNFIEVAKSAGAAWQKRIASGQAAR